MKTLLIIPLLLLLGCATPQNGSTDSAAIILGMVEDAAAVGAQDALFQNPHWRDRFETARAELTAAIDGGRFDAATFRLIMNRLPVKELKSREARIGITFATLQFRRHGAQLGIDQPEWIKAGMVAVRNGLETALGAGM